MNCERTAPSERPHNGEVIVRVHRSDEGVGERFSFAPTRHATPTLTLSISEAIGCRRL